jgi:lysophospholipase L1-like esterase
MKTLYTVGDSFTYGEELKDRNSAWPHVLGKLLGHDVVNEGKRGTGNHWCVKRTINAVTQHTPDLVVVAWTSCGRQEFNDQHGAFTIWPGCSEHAYWLHPDQAPDVDRKTLSRWLTMYSEPVYELRNWIRQVLLLQSFLKQSNIQYRFVNTFDNFELMHQLNHQAHDLIDMIDTTMFVGWPDEQMVEWAYGTPQGPGGHPLELGHQRIAEAIHAHINTGR